jgi:hypothetical protein
MPLLTFNKTQIKKIPMSMREARPACATTYVGETDPEHEVWGMAYFSSKTCYVVVQ